MPSLQRGQIEANGSEGFANSDARAAVRRFPSMRNRLSVAAGRRSGVRAPRRLAALSGALAALALVAGCSGGDGDEAGSKAAPPATTVRETVPSTETAAAPPEERTEAAAEFLVRVNEYVRQGQFRRAWLLLHPAHKRAIRASALASCLGQSQWPPNAQLRVTETYPEPWDIPGGPRNAPSTAVTIRVVVSYSEEGSDVTSVLETFTQHAFDVDGGWRWILNSAAFEAVETSGTC